MISNKGGFSLEMFEVSQISNFLICPVCQKVVRDPTQCASCQIIYCKECTMQQGVENCWQCNEKFKHMKVSRLLRGILEDKEVKCLKCEEKMKLCDYLEKHEQKCDNPSQSEVEVKPSPVEIVNNETYESSNQSSYYFSCQCSQYNIENQTSSSIIKHEQECPYSITQCPNPCCEKFLYRYELAHHIEDECLFKTEQCEFCQKHIPIKYKKEHQKQKCQNVKVKCSYKGCCQLVQRSDLTKHWNEFHKIMSSERSKLYKNDEKKECCVGREIKCLLF